MTTAITTIRDIGAHVGQTVTLQGWLFNRRSSKKLRFLQVRDGSGFIQAVVVKGEVDDALFDLADTIPQESSVVVTGTVRQDERAPFCGHELGVTSLRVVQAAQEYPISKKDHGDAFLMDNRHLWLRSFKQHTILRVRATLIRAIRDYLDDHGFVCMDSPIFTPAACEGTTTLFETKYFDTMAYLSQSGQLYQEAGCMALGKTYCFGPTFRSEKSKTRRHLTEFWMVEPEAAFLDIDGDMDLIEDFLCSIVARVLDTHGKEIRERLERDLAPLERVQKPFPRVTYDDALRQIAEIREACTDPELKQQLEITWGMDFGSPHETELTKRYDRPVMVHRWPAECKAFYMKKADDNPKIALGVDVLAPEGYGEIVGGAQREDDLGRLVAEIERHKLPMEEFGWFLDLRRYGSVPHAGFGMGLERTVGWICGLHHVRETIPFARTMDRLRP
jgi:asparaginyl-tRNA synthetase